MKKIVIIVVGIVFCIFFVSAQNNVSFFEEHIDFLLTDDYFTINGIYSFTGKTGKDEVQQIIFPFSDETRLIDSIRIVDLNTCRNIEFKPLKNSVYFKISVPANDTVDINIFYRQKTAAKNKYIITSTKSWGEPLKTAVYSLISEKKIQSFTYEPDSIKVIGNQKIYLWKKHDFMPETDFEITIND